LIGIGEDEVGTVRGIDEGAVIIEDEVGGAAGDVVRKPGADLLGAAIAYPEAGDGIEAVGVGGPVADGDAVGLAEGEEALTLALGLAPSGADDEAGAGVFQDGAEAVELVFIEAVRAGVEDAVDITA
jgi:hypothetical protein